MDSKSLLSKKHSSKRAWNGVIDENEEARKEERLRKEEVEDLGSLEGTEGLKQEDGFTRVISKTKSLLEEELDLDSLTQSQFLYHPSLRDKKSRNDESTGKNQEALA